MAQKLSCIAVTGGIATGKSTVLEAMAMAGLKTDSADRIADEVRRLPEVIAFLNSEEAGLSSNREVLRQKLLVDDGFRLRLNKMMHPLIWDRISTCGAEAIEIPLLFETCIHHRFQEVWVTECDETTQLSRLVERWGSEQLACQAIESQLKQSVKVALADAVVRTNGPRDDVFREIGRHFAAK